MDPCLSHTALTPPLAAVVEGRKGHGRGKGEINANRGRDDAGKTAQFGPL